MHNYKSRFAMRCVRKLLPITLSIGLVVSNTSVAYASSALQVVEITSDISVESLEHGEPTTDGRETVYYNGELYWVNSADNELVPLIGFSKTDDEADEEKVSDEKEEKSESKEETKSDEKTQEKSEPEKSDKSESQESEQKEENSSSDKVAESEPSDNNEEQSSSDKSEETSESSDETVAKDDTAATEVKEDTSSSTEEQTEEKEETSATTEDKKDDSSSSTDIAKDETTSDGKTEEITEDTKKDDSEEISEDTKKDEKEDSKKDSDDKKKDEDTKNNDDDLTDKEDTDNSKEVSDYDPSNGDDSYSYGYSNPLQYDYSGMTDADRIMNLTYGMEHIDSTSYGICNAETWVDVHVDKSTESEVVGKLQSGDVCYVIADEDDAWVYIESGNVRGFVFKYYLITGEEAQKTVEESGGIFRFNTAEESISPLLNEAFRYVMITTGDVASSYNMGSMVGYSAKRQEIVDYAEQFVGYPYVWGGNDPHTGADCSGFVKYVYSHFGVTLPRVSDDQAYVGKKIPVNEARPGDLIFFADASGHVYHVAMSTGGRNTVEAKSRRAGIVNSNVGNRNACWATRLIDDDISINTGNGRIIRPEFSTMNLIQHFSYELWDRENVSRDWSAGTPQRRLRNEYENFDSEGFGRIGDRYVVAATPKYGNIGDFVDFIFTDGTVIKAVLGDHKNTSDSRATVDGHAGGKVMVEFIVNGYSNKAPAWYATHHENAGTSSCHPELAGKKMSHAINYGNIWN